MRANAPTPPPPPKKTPKLAGKLKMAESIHTVHWRFGEVGNEQHKKKWQKDNLPELNRTADLQVYNENLQPDVINQLHHREDLFFFGIDLPS